MKLSAFFITSLVAVLAGCNGNSIDINGERPRRQPQSLSVAPLESHIVLSAKIDLQKIREPMKLSNDPDIWLRIGPKAISFSEIHAQDNILRTSLSIGADMEAVLGKRPEPFPASSLTEVGNQVQEESKSVLRLPIKLEYASLKREFKKVLKIDQKWAPFQDKPNYYWTVKDVEIYPSEENLVVGIYFIADFPIDLLNTSIRTYIMGKPVIDNEQPIVRVENLNFTAKMDNVLTQIVSSFLRQKIRDELESALTYRFTDRVEKALNDVNGKLNKDLGYGVKIQGTLNYKKVDKIVMVEDGIYLGTILEGELEMTFGM